MLWSVCHYFIPRSTIAPQQLHVVHGNRYMYNMSRCKTNSFLQAFVSGLAHLNIHPFNLSGTCSNLSLMRHCCC